MTIRINRLPKAANGRCLTVISSFACYEHSFFSFFLSIDYFEYRSTFCYFFVFYFFVSSAKALFVISLFFISLFRVPKHFSLFLCFYYFVSSAEALFVIVCFILNTFVNSVFYYSTFEVSFIQLPLIFCVFRIITLNAVYCPECLSPFVA